MVALPESNKTIRRGSQIRMQTETQPTQPLEFIDVVNNTSFINSTSNDNDIHFEEEEENSMTLDDLLSFDGDASYDDRLFSSSDDMISFGSAENSESSLTSEFSLTSEDDEDPLDFLDSYPAYLSEATNPAKSKADKNKIPQLIESSDGKAGCNRYAKDILELSAVRSRLYSDCSTATSTMPLNSLPSDLNSASYSVAESSDPTSVTSAEECLERSNLRLFSASCSNVFTLPKSLLCDKNDEAPIASHVSYEASTTTSSTGSRRKSTDSSSSVSRLTSSVISSSTTLSTLSALVLENEAFLEDYDLSPCAARVGTIKRQLRTMEIQHYRAKCVRSLRRSMIRYKKISEDNDSSSVSFLDNDESLSPAISEDVETKPVAKAVMQFAMEVARDILCFNLIIAVFYIYYFLYKDTIIQVIQGAGVTHLFSVSV